MASNQSNVPVEMIEADYPLRIESYGIRAGHGRRRPLSRRAGLEARIPYPGRRRFFGVRSDKRRFPPHGLFGGGEGAPSTNTVEKDNELTVVPTLPTEPIMLGHGDVFRHMMAGGGGYGMRMSANPSACSTMCWTEGCPLAPPGMSTASCSRPGAAASTAAQPTACAAWARQMRRIDHRNDPEAASYMATPPFDGYLSGKPMPMLIAESLLVDPASRSVRQWRGGFGRASAGRRRGSGDAG